MTILNIQSRADLKARNHRLLLHGLGLGLRVERSNSRLWKVESESQRGTMEYGHDVEVRGGPQAERWTCTNCQWFDGYFTFAEGYDPKSLQAPCKHILLALFARLPLEAQEARLAPALAAYSLEFATEGEEMEFRAASRAAFATMETPAVDDSATAHAAHDRTIARVTAEERAAVARQDATDLYGPLAA